MWFTIYYSPNRHTNAPLQMRGRFYGNLSGAGKALALLRSGHPQAGQEGWYMLNDATGQWVNAWIR